MSHSRAKQARANRRVVGKHSGLKEVFSLVELVASLPTPVLLLGETGVGKEVIARAIHTRSDRKAHPLVKVNCAAIPDTLMDNELFGHEKGSYTGAQTQHVGLFERAHRGTVFLDEIGELHEQAQCRLLRVLQDHELERVGGTRPIRVDIRVIAATHRDLARMVREGSFREDLYFRLRVFPIVIPPLRQRKMDIPKLVEHFAEKKWKELALPKVPKMAAEANDRLAAHEWPGNVRELEHVVEREMILSRGDKLRFEDLRQATAGGKSKSRRGQSSTNSNGQPLTLDEVVTHHIRQVLRLTNGQVEGTGGAAAILGMNPATLRSKMRRLGIPFGRERRASGD